MPAAKAGVNMGSHYGNMSKERAKAKAVRQTTNAAGHAGLKAASARVNARAGARVDQMGMGRLRRLSADRPGVGTAPAAPKRGPVRARGKAGAPGQIKKAAASSAGPVRLGMPSKPGRRVR